MRRAAEVNDEAHVRSSLKPALLFDLDGTLTDDDELHFDCMRDSFAAQDVALDWPAFKSHIVGALNADIAAHFFPHLTPEEGKRVLDDKEAIFRTRVHRLSPTPGVVALLDFARAHDVAVALVTNAPRANADAMLTALGLDGRFAAVVAGDEVAAGKPDPLPYLTGLKVVGGDVARAVAFEDSVAGATAAVRAGVTTIGVGRPTAFPALIAAGVALTAPDFTDPRVLAQVRATLAL